MLTWKNALALPAVLFVALGCGGKADDKTKTATVKGTVTLGDAPLPSGKITFDEGPTVPAVELDIKDGKYEGPVTVGKKTVRITAMKAGKAPPGMAGPGYENGIEVNYLPAKYNTASKETREVKDGGPNEFDFKVTTK